MRHHLEKEVHNETDADIDPQEMPETYGANQIGSFNQQAGSTRLFSI